MSEVADCPALSGGKVTRLIFPKFNGNLGVTKGAIMIRKWMAVGRKAFRIQLIAVLTGVIALTGCTGGGLPPAPQLAQVTDFNYHLGPGDAVNIIVWRNPELSASVPVRPDGKISAPLIEDLPALGKDPTSLARDIEKALSKFIRDPVVTVVVTSFAGPYGEQIRVIGEAAKPQVLPYKQKMTVLDVMIAVGGITEYADGNGASILRAAEGNKQYSVRLKDLVKGGDVGANVEMMPGDVLVIPRSWF